MDAPDTFGRTLTVSEFEAMPEEDLYRVELVRGKLVRSPRPASLHGRIAARLCRLLDAYAEDAGRGVVLADAGVILSRNPDTVRGPDVALFTPERIPESAYATTFWGPPDLAIEIASPSNHVSAMRAKVADYLDAGVRRVWVVDPSTRSVTVWRPGGEARLLRGEDVLEDDVVVPGLRIPLLTLFTL